MEMWRKAPAYLLLVLLLSACAGSSVKQRINLAEALLEGSPKEAIAMLDSASNGIPAWNVPLRMRVELLRAQAMNKAFISFTTDSITLEVVNFYNIFGDSNQRMAANYMAGCAYRDLGDVPNAIKYYRRAIEAADTADSSCNLRMLYCIHGQAALLYAKMLVFEHELKENMEAERIAWKIGEDANAIAFMWGRAACHYMQKRYDRTTEILDSIADILKERRLPERPELVYPMKINIRLAEKDGEGAAHLLKELEEKMRITAETPSEELPVYEYLQMKGQAYVLNACPDSAILMFHRSLKHFSRHEFREAAYRGLKDAYALKHMPDSTIKYANLYCSENDSVMLERSSENLLRMQAIYDYTTAQEHTLKLQRQKEWLIWTIIGCALLCCIIYFAAKKIHKKLQEEQRQQQQNLMHLSERFESQTAELQEVKAKAVHHIQEKEKEIGELQHTLDTLKDDIVRIRECGKNREVFDSELLLHLHNLATHGKASTPEELFSLLCFAKHALPEFFEHINGEEYGLTPREINVCLLMRFNFKSSEMAVLLDTTSQRITNLKTFINKKLFGENGAKNLGERLAGLG